MKGAPHLALVSLLLFPACTILDVHAGQGSGPYFEASGVLRGYARAGQPQRSSLVKLELLSGRSPGSILNLEVWPLLRVEVGVLGAALGVLGLDLGIGALFYHPVPWVAPAGEAADEPSAADSE